MENLWDMTGHTALVVGGGLGMGRASAGMLARAGASVAVLDIEPDRVNSVVGAITEAGGRAIGIVQDVKDDLGLVAAVERAAAELDGLDVLVDVVGGATWSPAIDMDPDLFEQEARHNLRHLFVAAQAFARLPERGNGRSIVGIASISGLNSSPNHAAYGAAKAGLMSLVRTLAQEWGPRGIRVNAVSPGAIRTDRNRPEGEMLEHIESFTPLRRIGYQDEIGGAVLFLASSLASYVSGQTLLVDGGLQTNYPFPIG